MVSRRRRVRGTRSRFFFNKRQNLFRRVVKKMKLKIKLKNNDNNMKIRVIDGRPVRPAVPVAGVRYDRVRARHVR